VRARRTFGALAAALLLTACSDDDDGGDLAEQQPEEVQADAIEAMGSVDSVRIELVLGSGEQEFRQDVSVGTDGSCTGTVEQPNGTTEVLRNADGAWYRPSQSLVESLYPGRAAEAVAFVGDKWVADVEDVITGSTCDLDNLVEALGDDRGADTKVVGTEEIDGHEVVRLEYTTEEGDGTAFVRADAPHYIVRMEVEGGLSGHMAFSEFDEPLTVEAPPRDQVVDLTKLGQER
jgi:hypothetical protein